MKPHVLISFCCISLLGFDCRMARLERDYEAAVTSGRQMEVVRQMEQMFPDSVHWITYFTQQAGQPIWNSQTALFERYILTLQFQIRIDGTEVSPSAPPSWVLVEVTEVVHLPTGQALIHHGDQWTLTGQQWKTLVESNGDFEVVGIELKRDQPTPNFRRALVALHWDQQ